MNQALVTVATYWDPVEARLSRIHLDAAGIGTVLQNEHSITMNWLEFANSSKGVQLQVEAADVDAALKVLEQTTPKDAEMGDEWKADVPVRSTHENGADEEAPAVGQEDRADPLPLNAREMQIQRAYVAAVLGVFFLPLEFYSTYQLGVTFLSMEPLRPQIRSKARQAMLINAAMLLGFFWLASLYI